MIKMSKLYFSADLHIHFYQLKVLSAGWLKLTLRIIQIK